MSLKCIVRYVYLKGYRDIYLDQLQTHTNDVAKHVIGCKMAQELLRTMGLASTVCRMQDETNSKLKTNNIYIFINVY